MQVKVEGNTSSEGPLNIHVDGTPDATINEEKVQLNKDNSYFEWKDICAHVKINKSETKQILHNITGRLGKGKLMAILGGSGAGKSTFLNAISGRLITQGKKKVTGTIAYHGSKYELGHNNSIKSICAYVMQSDILCATETSREALEFSAHLRLPKTMSKKEKDDRVENIIKELKLEKCENTLIGNDAIRGVSGGEKKRVSVGVELVTDPNLIFLDEPTSGLDSFTALKTLNILKELTLKGKQVIATIHQPSSEIFALFDELLLLSNGHVVYFGSAQDAIIYFKNIGYECPQYSNPADHFINSIQQNSEYFIDAWNKYILNDKTHNINQLNFNNYDELKSVHKNQSSFLTQLYYIFKREIDIFIRDPRPSKIRFVQTVVFAALVALLYWDLPHNQSGLRDRFGAIFFLTINSSMTGMISTIITFPEQRVLFERERDNQMYNTLTYVISKSLIGLPEQMLFTLIYLIIVYWSVGLDSNFGEIYLSLVLCMISSGSIGLIVGCFANNVGEAMQIMPLAFIPFILFANFLVSLDQIPVFIRWIQWIDPFKYMVDALCITEYNNISYSGSPFTNGDLYLSSLKVNTNDLAFDWYMLAILFFGFRLITAIILVIRNGW